MIRKDSIQKILTKINSHSPKFLDPLKKLNTIIDLQEKVDKFLFMVNYLAIKDWFWQFNEDEQIYIIKEMLSFFFYELKEDELVFPQLKQILIPTFKQNNYLRNFSNDIQNFSQKFSIDYDTPASDFNLNEILKFQDLMQFLRFYSKEQSNSQKINMKSHGSYYTSIEIVKYIYESQTDKIVLAMQSKKKIKICDFSCGMGAFLFFGVKFCEKLIKDHNFSCKVSFLGLDSDNLAIIAANLCNFIFKCFNKNLQSSCTLIFRNIDSLNFIPSDIDSTNFTPISFEKEKIGSQYKSDFIFSNPPYISWGLGRVGKIEKKDEKWLRSSFSNSAEYKISYYAIFIERAFQLLSSGSMCSLLIPDSFLIGKYFSKIRNFLLSKSEILSIELFKHDFWTQANSGLPVILTFLKNNPNSNRIEVNLLEYEQKKVIKISSNFILPEYFLSLPLSRFRLVFSQQDMDFLNRIERDNPPLKEFFELHHGIRSKKGIGKEKIVNTEKKNEFWKLGLISSKELHQFCITSQNKYINTEPRYLYSGGFDPSHIEQPKILIRRTSSSIIAAVDEINFYHTNTLIYLIKKENTQSWMTLYALCAIFNSKIINTYYNLTSLKQFRTLPQVEIDSINELPLKFNKPIWEKLSQLSIKIHKLNRIESLKKEKDKENLEKNSHLVLEYESVNYLIDQCDILVEKLYE